MNASDYFSRVGDIAVFRPTGKVLLEEAVQFVTSAIVYAREQRIRKVLVATSALTGFKAPSLVTRQIFIREWARTADGTVVLALEARMEMIDRQKFGVIVAANAGMVSEIFPSEDEALAWLRGTS